MCPKNITKIYSYAAAALLVSLFCIEAAAFGGDMEITFFSVGKADSILLKQGGSAMLVDTATSEDAPYILERLAEKGVTSLDALLITHMDKDHVGGAAQILSEIPTAAVYQPN